MDWSLIAPIVDAFHAHQFGYVALGAFLLLVNVARSAKSDAWYVEKLDSVPRVHALLEMARSLGIDPVGLIAAFVKLLSGAKPKPVASKAPDGTVDVVIPSATKDEAPVSMKIGSALLFVGALSLLGSQSGCAWATQNEQAIAQDSAKFVLCVTGELFAGEKDFGRIAVKCGKQATADVIALITEQDRQVSAGVGKARASGYVAGVTATVSVCEGKK